MIQVLLLDDHVAVRQGYRLWIDGEPDMRVVSAVATSMEACEALRHCSVDVAVIDLGLKNDSGFEAMRRLRERRHDLKLLVLTMHHETCYAVQSMRLGAAGYLTKDADPQQVLDALRQVALGRCVFDPEVAQACIQHGRATPGPLSELTPREFDVLRLATAGLDNAAIAKALLVSEKTVLNTMSHVRMKLGERNDFRLMRLAAQHGLVADLRADG